MKLFKTLVLLEIIVLVAVFILLKTIVYNQGLLSFINYQTPSSVIITTYPINNYEQKILSPTLFVTNDTNINPTINPVMINYNQNVPTEEWGVAKKIDEHTYTIKVGSDDRMGTPEEILKALNEYRQTNHKGPLALDEKLSRYAQERAELFQSIQDTDKHSGFSNFLNNEDGFQKLGFSKLGENSYYGDSLYGVHLIEWVFAKSNEHNANQLDSMWSYAGIGVTNTSVNIIFAALPL